MYVDIFSFNQLLCRSFLWTTLNCFSIQIMSCVTLDKILGNFHNGVWIQKMDINYLFRGVFNSFLKHDLGLVNFLKDYYFFC